jgi:hypothetical protein
MGYSRHVKKEGEIHIERGEGDPEERERRRISRARRELTRKIIYARLDHMVTPTYRENMEDLEQAKIDFVAFVSLVRVRFPDWHYVAVFEIQKKRAERTGFRVIHPHIAVRGFQDVNFLRECWHRVVGEKGGGVNVAYHKSKKKCRLGRLDLARYLAKYIGKDMELHELNKKSYWHSEGVESPPVDRIQFDGPWTSAREWGAEIFRAEGARIFRSWEHETGLYGYMSSF